MKAERSIVVINMECKVENQEAFTEWYNGIHIPMALKYPGLMKASRYELSAKTTGTKTYLTIFEFKDRQAMESFPASPEVAAAKEEMQQRWQGKLPFEIKSRNEYDPIANWDKNESK
jgi:antibiotic biosynthesis monooxygenase (ABM) superfamily enzyme